MGVPKRVPILVSKLGPSEALNGTSLGLEIGPTCVSDVEPPTDFILGPHSEGVGSEILLLFIILRQGFTSPKRFRFGVHFDYHFRSEMDECHGLNLI